MPRDSSSIVHPLNPCTVWRTSGVVPLRPHDLMAKSKPKPARQPTMPSERFVSALFGASSLGLEVTKSDDFCKNVALKLSVEEHKGATEGIFQDPSTYKLVLALEPGLFMRHISVTLDTFVGDEDQYWAPTWLIRLRMIKGWRVEYVRIYSWVFAFVRDLLTTPGAAVPALDEWVKVFDHVRHIKEHWDRLAIPHPQPGTPRVRPRPRRSANELVGAYATLTLNISS
ncbi:hypothetical protein OH77DRAFT_1594226 [Trametes cingulata]|nr:hypothetical protein OH77DRAFT_1594226 [Trametes cingulata]